MSTITHMISELTEAEAQVVAMDADAERARILASAARPATKREVAARAENLRTQLAAFRLNAVADYNEQIQTVYLATEALDDAQLALANAAITARDARKKLEAIRHTIEQSYNLQHARDMRDDNAMAGDDRAAAHAAVQAAQAAVNKVMSELPPTPATLASRLGSSAIGVSLEQRRRREAIKLTNASV